MMTLTADNCDDPDLKLAKAILHSVTESESTRLGYPVTLTKQQVHLALEQARFIGEFPDFNS